MEQNVHKTILNAMIGQCVWRARQAIGMTQYELAKDITSEAWITLIESGQDLPSHDVLRALAGRLSDKCLSDHLALMESTLSGSFFDRIDIDFATESLLSHAVGWSQEKLDAVSKLAEKCVELNRFDLAITLFKEVSDRSLDIHRKATAHYYLGFAHLIQGNQDGAEKWFGLAESNMNYLKPLFQGKLYYNVSYMHFVGRNYPLCMMYAHLADRAFRDVDEFMMCTKSMVMLGLAESRMGLLEHAKKSLERANDLAQKFGYPTYEIATLHNNLADVYESIGDNLKAEMFAETAIENGIRSGDEIVPSLAYGILCRVRHAKGDTVGARKALHESIKYARLSGDADTLSWAMLQKSMFEESIDERIEAALDVVKMSGKHQKLQKILAQETLAKLYFESGDRKASFQYIWNVLESYREFIGTQNDISAISKHMKYIHRESKTSATPNQSVAI